MRAGAVAVAARTVGLVGVVLALAACSGPVPVPSATPGLGAPGAALPAQSDRIVRHTLAELAAADAASDPRLLTERVTGAAAQSRAAEYIVAAKGGAAPEVIPSALLAVYTTGAETWPRAMVGVTEPADASHTPVVLLWVQDGAAAPYQLRQWAHMLPGAVLPAMPGAAVGSEQLPLTAVGFTATPKDVIDDYIALLNAGSTSDLESAFAADIYRDRMFAARTTLAASATAKGGTYADTIVAHTDQAVVLSDAEGGALIFLPIGVVSDFTVPGQTLALPASDKALLTGTLGSRVIHHYEDLIVLRIRAGGSGVIPVVVAADHHLVAVTTS